MEDDMAAVGVLRGTGFVPVAGIVEHMHVVDLVVDILQMAVP